MGPRKKRHRKQIKDKKIAAIFAFFLGGLGIHRFYLGQVGLGILYLVFFWIFPLMFIIGIIDAIAFLSMDQRAFDKKYNRDHLGSDELDRRYERRRRPDRRSWRSVERNRRSRSRRKKKTVVRKNPFKKSGIDKFKDYDYEGAISDFQKALEINPDDIAVHFNLACAYSLMEETDKSLHHLNTAIENGFNDFERIKTHDALAFLRIQPEFEAYEENGFKFDKPQAPPPEIPKEKESGKASPADENLLEQLKKLSDLRERGLLSEEEFLTQKRKLMQ